MGGPPRTAASFYSENMCTHIYRIKKSGGAGWPPPPIIFERLKLPQQIIYRRKENLSESPNHQKYYRRNLGHFRKFEKISNSQNMNILYIILKHVIWRFQIYNLFREICKFREDKSNNVFREIRKCFRKTAKFEFFKGYEQAKLSFQVISIDARKGVWVSAIFSFKTLLGYGLLLKRYINSN